MYCKVEMKANEDRNRFIFHQIAISNHDGQKNIFSRWKNLFDNHATSQNMCPSFAMISDRSITFFQILTDLVLEL